jgi:cytochrome P450
MGVATTDPVRLPPAPPIPKALQGLAFLINREKAVATVGRRYGSEFTLNLPIFGEAVVISDPALVKELFTMNTDLIARAGTLGDVLGPGSTFSLDGTAHRQRRKLLVPPFHGKRMQGYEQIVEEEVLREIATWQEGEEFATMPSMMRITLNAILRAVFGADGAALEELRELLPAMVLKSSRLAVLPPTVRRDLGPWSPAGRAAKLRRRYDAIISGLIADARTDPGFEERSDVLALLLRARYDDGSPISDDHVADELLTLLAAGHETTATTLAWAVERLRRRPALLRELAEAEDGKLLDATILEVQRTRPVIDLTARQVKQDGFRLGRWTLPKGYVVLVSIALIHDDDALFPHAATFDPHRFAGARPDLYQWIPFGGGTRRCLGAAFATMEMTVVLRTLLRDFTLEPTAEADERRHSRGVAYAPAKGGRAVVRRRGGIA